MAQTKELCDAVSTGNISDVRRMIEVQHASPHDYIDNYKLGDFKNLRSKLTPLHVACL